MENNQKILFKRESRFQFIMVAFCIFFSTKTSTLSTNPYLFWGVTSLLTFYIFNNTRVVITKKFTKIIIIFFLLTIITNIQHSDFTPLFFVSKSVLVFFAFLTIVLLKDRFFILYEYIIYILALVSLPLFILQLISFDLIYNIARVIESNILIFELVDNKSATLILWNLQSGFHENRNCGFMWEPSAFAAMLLLPIMINLVLNNFKINKRLVVLVIALLTTMSTMGYLSLMVITVFYIYNTKTKYSLLLLPGFIYLFILIFNLSFMKDKIVHEYKNIDNTIYSAFNDKYNKMRSLGRMGSFAIDYGDLKKHPILGVGGHDQLRTSSDRLYINKTNGLSRFLLTFGLIGGFLLIYGLSRTYKYFSIFNKSKGSFFFVIIVLMFAFSNSILTTPLLFTNIFYTFFAIDKLND